MAGYAPAPSRTRKSMTSQLFEGSQAAVRSRQQLTPASPVPDIDSADADDPLKASSYATDIFSYYRRTEVNFRPLPTYMSRQVSGVPLCSSQGSHSAALSAALLCYSLCMWQRRLPSACTTCMLVVVSGDIQLT